MKGIHKNWIRFFILMGIILVINFISMYINTYFDLTEDKRYTLTKPTEDLIESIDEVIYIKVLLDGDFPAGFKRLQSSTKEILDQFKSINQNIVLMFCSQVSLVKEIITSFLSNVKYAQENEKEFIQNDLFDLITKLNDFKEMCLDKVFYMTDKL